MSGHLHSKDLPQRCPPSTPQARVKAFLKALVLIAAFLPGIALAEIQTNELSSTNSLWNSGIAEGFRSGAMELDFAAGPGLGLPILLSLGHHDWVLGLVDYGWVFTDVLAPRHWYRGNWELLGEIFGGAQFHPVNAWFIGGGPHLRYNFAAGHHCVPFIDLGAGATATSIREGDLSTTFEFNLQAGAGAHFFVRDDLALTLQWRFIHFSNAGIEFPNLGVNSSTFLFGVSWFF